MAPFPKFSVIIPTYNRAGVLAEAINSVLRQTCADFEIVVVDDGSSDNTKSLLEGLCDSRIKKIFIDKVGIIGAVRNAGIKQARGKFIAFLDSDDVWYPEKLNKVSEAFEQKNPVLVCHNMLEKRADQDMYVHKYGPANEKMYERLLFSGNCLGTSATVVRADILRQAGLFSEDKRFIGAEDYECWLNISRLGAFSFIDQVLGEYRIKGGNVSRDVHKITENRINVIKHHYAKVFDKQTPGTDRLIKTRLSDIFGKSARALQVDGCFDDALHYYMNSLRENFFAFISYLGLVTSLLRLRLNWVSKAHLYLINKSVRY